MGETIKEADWGGFTRILVHRSAETHSFRVIYSTRTSPLEATFRNIFLFFQKHKDYLQHESNSMLESNLFDVLSKK